VGETPWRFKSSHPHNAFEQDFPAGKTPNAEGSIRMSDRSDEAEERVPLEVPERLAVVARLRPGSADRARQILAAGAPYELGESGFLRHSVFLAEETVVFVFEAPGIERLVRELVDDPTSSATFSVWGPLLEGMPVLAREEFYWEAG
jgi:hypothetical protein